MARRVIGVMTGTSLDGMDVAAVDVTGHGLEIDVTLVGHRSSTLEPLVDRLRDAATQVPMSAGAFASLGMDFGRLVAERVANLAAATGQPDLVAVHGQTIHHDPPVSWQLLEPAPIAETLRCPVVCDLRQADLAAGGQGAPITPLADWIMFRAEHRRAIVNLGGFCNVTILPAAGAPAGVDAIGGFDVCVCNQMLDAIARTALDAPMDRDGAAAATGRVDFVARDALATQLERQRADGRSLGTGDETTGWLDEHRGRLDGRDLAATAVAAIGAVIRDTITPHDVCDIVVAGGGARNRALFESLGPGVVASDTLCIPVNAREAVAMAVLGTLCADGVPITLPQVTGCQAPAPVAGRWIARPLAAAPVIAAPVIAGPRS